MELIQYKEYKTYNTLRSHTSIWHHTIRNMKQRHLATPDDQEVLYCIADCYWLSTASILEDKNAKEFSLFLCGIRVKF